MGKFVGTYCQGEGFSAAEATQVDNACGQAGRFVDTVVNTLGGLNYASLPDNVRTALAHHFGFVPITFPLGEPGEIEARVLALDGNGSILAIDFNAKQADDLVRNELWLNVIREVYKKMQSDLDKGMNYERGNYGGAIARTTSTEIILYAAFFTRSFKLQPFDLIHEQAHYARGSWKPIVDVGSTWVTDGAYAELDMDSYSNLTRDDAARNADCYAWFAHEIADPGSFTWPGPPVVKSPPRTHIVRPGDWLSKLAKAYYGDINKWPLIQDANSQIVRDPNKLKVGTQLVIPDLSGISPGHLANAEHRARQWSRSGH
jgi:nucleoid-associated protein YgaU